MVISGIAYQLMVFVVSASLNLSGLAGQVRLPLISGGEILAPSRQTDSKPLRRPEQTRMLRAVSTLVVGRLFLMHLLCGRGPRLRRRGFRRETLLLDRERLGVEIEGTANTPSVDKL